MSTELAMNAYVLLGNTLHYLLHSLSAGVEEQLAVTPGALVDLNQRIEPLPPATILAGVTALTPPERDLLARSIRLCLSSLSSEAITNLLGIPEDVARQTLTDLGLDGPGERVQA